MVSKRSAASISLRGTLDAEPCLEWSVIRRGLTRNQRGHVDYYLKTAAQN
jgi:hypothetical protein